MSAEPLRDYIFNAHALEAMSRRRITRELVERVLAGPEQRVPSHAGRTVLQSRVELAGKLYLVRVVVALEKWPPQVITVYRTRRIARYWKPEQ
ncbi:MAG: DUF4258 domain-containing protein [Longimicrobiales bacterium]